MSGLATDVNVPDTDELVDYIFEGSEEQGRTFRCRKCGVEFRSDKKAPTLCPDCRAKIASETGRIGGRISKAMQAAKKADGAPEVRPEPETMAREKILRSAQDDRKGNQDDRTAEARPTTLTIGGLRRLLEGQGLDGAEITIDGQPVKSVYVEHYYNLANGTETYRVELG